MNAEDIFSFAQRKIKSNIYKRNSNLRMTKSRFVLFRQTKTLRASNQTRSIS